MVHSRCSSTAGVATDRDASGRDTFAEIAAGSVDAAVPGGVGVEKHSSVAVATPGDSDQLAVVAVAPIVGCASDRFDCCYSRYRDSGHAGDPNHDSPAAVVFVAPRSLDRFADCAESAPAAAAAHAAAAIADRAPATGEFDPVVVVASAVLVPENLGFAVAVVVLSAAYPDSVAGFAVAVSVVPSAAAYPGYRAVAAVVAVPSVAVSLDSVAPAAGVVVASALIDRSVVAAAVLPAELPAATAALVDAVPFVLDSVDCVPRHDRAYLERSRRRQPSTDLRIRLLK